MTAASRSLATALWRARFASGLLPSELHHHPGHDRLVPFAWHRRRRFPQFNVRARTRLRAASMPDAAWPVSRSRPG